MADGGRIVGGVVLAVALAAGPLWLASARGARPEQPVPAAGREPCVESREEMRLGHPTLLANWREQAVRAGERLHRTEDGRRIRIGLTATCLGCHGPAQQFCDRCHSQVGLTLTCWQCHSPLPRESR